MKMPGSPAFPGVFEFRADCMKNVVTAQSDTDFSTAL